VKGFKTIPPKQRYMTLAEIHETYGSRGVIAYSCKVADSVPEGGFVIAVQDEANTDYKSLKEYHRQIKQKYPSKEPVYFLRVETAESGKYLKFIYDNGIGERTALPKIEVKKSEAEGAINRIPDEILAQALITSLRTPPKE